eukprot:3544860-Ditylum_brightwellii.AAC.1
MGGSWVTHTLVSNPTYCQFSLAGLSHHLGIDVPDHHPGWATLCGQVASFYAICHEEIAGVDVSGAFAAQAFS